MYYKFRRRSEKLSIMMKKDEGIKDEGIDVMERIERKI